MKCHTRPHRHAAALCAGILLCIVGCSHEGGSEWISLDRKQCEICHAVPPNDQRHEVHVGRREFECDACHRGNDASAWVTNAETHHNGRTDVVFSQGDSASYDPGTSRCANVYCHGAFPQGTRASVSFTTDRINGQCDACHALDSVQVLHHGHSSTEQVNQCGYCHLGYSLEDSTVAKSTHIDGVTRATGSRKCTVCHTGWQ